MFYNTALDSPFVGNGFRTQHIGPYTLIFSPDGRASDRVLPFPASRNAAILRLATLNILARERAYSGSRAEIWPLTGRVYLLFFRECGASFFFPECVPYGESCLNLYA